jgi:hypothetical protein
MELPWLLCSTGFTQQASAVPVLRIGLDGLLGVGGGLLAPGLSCLIGDFAPGGVRRGEGRGWASLRSLCSPCLFLLPGVLCHFDLWEMGARLNS